MSQSPTSLYLLRAAFAAAALGLATSAAALEQLPDAPEAATRVPDGSTLLSQTREQNAVTSVRVQRGRNVYHVTPPEQIPYYQEGGRAATWEIFQFRSKPAADAAPPPTR